MNGEHARVAIVGSGEPARAHARVAVAHPDLSLVAPASADVPAARALDEEIVSRTEGAPAAFARHRRQNETILGRLGSGPLAEHVGARA